MALYVSGFLKYLESGKYADLVLISQHGKFHVHKIILVYSSEFFARLLLGEFRESKQTEIELKYPDPDNVFPTVLKFMYGGNISGLVDYHNVIALLAMADHYLIHELKEYCHQYIENHVTRNSALEILHKAIELQVHDMIEFYSNLISKAFCNIPNADYTQFSFPIFSKILHHKYLAVRDEYALYKVIMSYIAANREELNEKKIEELVECIRFRFMSFEQLQECQKDNMVPKHLLLEAIMFRLKTHEVPDKMDVETVSNNIRLQKRITCTTFEYKFDFDDRGILHYLATNGGTETWNKLELAKKVAVTASSIEMGKASDLLNKVPTELWSKDVPASWFTIDFGKSRRVFPTHYTLRHGGNYRADSLRTWDIQGSVDGKGWSVIKRHNQDTSLTDKFATHTWTINLDEHAAFRYFRILQTGRNSSNHNFLVLSGIEFYGDLYEWNDDEDSTSLDIHL